MNPPRQESTTLEAAIRGWAAERHLPQVQLERWLALSEGDRAALLETARALRLRTGQFATVFAMIEEIAVRERSSVAGELGRAEVRRIIDGAGSAPGRAHQLIEALRARRFPRLKQVHDRMAAAIAGLGLPGGIRVVLPRDLASDEVRVEISACGAIEMGRLVDALAGAREGLARVAAMAGGDSLDDEV